MRQLTELINEHAFKVQGWRGIGTPGRTADFASVDGLANGGAEIINLAVGAAGLVCVGILVYGGYTFIISGGDAEQVEKGYKMISGGVVGLIICFIAVLIVNFVLNEVIGG